MADRTIKPETLKRRIAKHKKEILAVIRKYNLFTVTDIFAYYKGCHRASFYHYGFDSDDDIKSELNNNKTITKRSVISKWATSDNATLQLALVKMISTDEERRALSLTFSEVRGDVTHKLLNLDPLADGGDDDQNDASAAQDRST